MSKLTIVNFGVDLEIGPPSSMARLATFDLAQERAGQGLLPPKLIELSIADRFIRAIRARGVDATIDEGASVMAEGTGDFVYLVGPTRSQHRVEVVRHVDGDLLAAQAARRRAIALLERNYPDCVAAFEGCNLMLNDDLADSILRSSIAAIAESWASPDLMDRFVKLPVALRIAAASHRA